MAETTDTICSDCLQLAQLAGGDGEPFRRRNGTQAGDEKFAADDHHHDPHLHHLRIVGDKGDERGRHHDLVGQRIEQHAHGGDLAAAAGQIAIQAVGNRGQNKENRRQNLLLPLPARENAATGSTGTAGS